MWVLYTPGQDPSRVYYGTGTRAFELLLGAILALVLSHPAGFVLRIPRWAWAAAGAIGATVTLLLWVSARQSATWLYRGGLAGYAVMSCLVIVATIRSGVIRSVLSMRVLRWLGGISYGVYLFHWPIFLWLTAARTHLSIWPLFGLRLAVTLVLAVLSAKLIELPVRERRRPVRFNPALLSGMAIVVVMLGTVVVTHSDPGERISFAAASSPELPPSTVAPSTSVTTVPAGQATTLTLPARPALAPGEAPRMLILGDSAALTLGNGLEAWGKGTGQLKVWNAGKLGCSVGRGGLLKYIGQIRSPYDYCDWTDSFTEQINGVQPHVIMVLFGTWDVVDRQLAGDSEWRAVGDPIYDAYMRSEISSAMDTMTAGGAEVVWLTHPYIRVGVNEGLPGPFPEEDRDRMDRLNAMIREVAASKQRVTVVDLEEHMRSLPEGDSDLGDRPDGIHWSINAAYAMAPWLGETITAIARDQTPPPVDASG